MKRPDPGQLALFEAVAAAASEASGVSPSGADMDVRLRGVLAGTMRASSRSREQIADAMAAELGVSVTAAMLNAWTAESKGATHRFPGAYLPAFCKAAGSMAPLGLLIEAAGGWCATKADRLRVERWAIEERKRDLRRQERMLDATMAALGRASSGEGAC